MRSKRIKSIGVGSVALAIVAGLAAPVSAAQQKVVDLSDSSVLSVEQLAQSLVGDSTELSNIKYTGAKTAAGIASGMNDVFGIDGGVVLTTGAASGDESIILGPNDMGGTSVYAETEGDADLDKIVDPNTTENASVLEFDFVPKGDRVTFSYVFGSDEYQEFVDSDFNDVFAFYVNGKNYATVDTKDGKVPVTINTINQNTNKNLYRDNYDDPTKYNTELDGFTTVLKFEAPVEATELNHMKLAIADTSDQRYDSAVLIVGGTLITNNPPVAEDQSYKTEFETPIDLALEGSDPDGDKVSYEILDQPDAAEGSLTAIDGNKLSFIPAKGFAGESTFTYRTNDGSDFSEAATVSVTVLEEGEELPTPSPSPSEDATPSATPSESSTSEPSESASPSETSSPDPSESASPSETSSPEPSESASSSAEPTEPSTSSSPSASSATPSESSSASAEPTSPSSSSSAPAGHDDSDDLADTGSNGALIGIAAGVVLVAFGALVFASQRRRTKH